MRKSAKVLLGLATLFAVGAAIGVLYAPDKGERTRNRLLRKSRKFYNSVNDTVAEGKEAMEQLRDELKDALDRANDQVQRLSKC